MGAFITRLLYGKKKWGTYAVLLRLPPKVLLEAFKFLNRRQLTNLERVCPRFHRIINYHMGEAPFLRLDFGLEFNDSDGLQTYIRKEEKWVFRQCLIFLPDYFLFLRFDSVFLIYNCGSQSIDEKLHLLQNRLQLFKTAFSDLKELNLLANINKNRQSQFRNHSQLLDHLHKQVLPVCDSSSVYNFTVDLQSDNDAAGNVIGKILQMPSINRCREVAFQYANATFVRLPVEVIANWLNRVSGDQIGCTEPGQSMTELFVAMKNRITIQNDVEMCDRLKMAFNDADSAVHPFRFSFSGGPVQRELIENEKTNEELYIDCAESDEHGMFVRIERSAKENKNSPETE